MGLWKRVRAWLFGSDEEALERRRVAQDDAYRQSTREEGLPAHYEEVSQPRQYPPSGGASF